MVSAAVQARSAVRSAGLSSPMRDWTRASSTSGSGTYINPRVLDQLRESRGAPWDTTKLVALAEELDACVQAGHVYASHAVLRALDDHVPPLFGQESFAAVVSSHA